MTLAHATWEQVRTADRTWHHRAYASALIIAGNGPTEHFLGDFHGASNIEGHSSARFYSTWLEANRGAWSLRSGILLADEEFATTESGAAFTNSAWGWPSFISANTRNSGPVFYIPAAGLRLQHQWNNVLESRLGMYDGDAFDSPGGDPTLTRHGLHHRLGGAQGWFIIGEIATRLPDNRTQVKIGAWAHTAKFDDLLLDEAGQPHALSGQSPAQHSGNHGVFVVLEHVLAVAPGSSGGIAAHLRAGTSPQDRNLLGWAFDAGVSWTGLLAARPDDVTALGVAHSHFGRHAVAHAQANDAGSPAPDFETVWEAAHTIAWSDRFTLQPSLQYLHHPGGDRSRRNALLLLVRFNATY